MFLPVGGSLGRMFAGTSDGRVHHVHGLHTECLCGNTGGGQRCRHDGRPESASREMANEGQLTVESVDRMATPRPSVFQRNNNAANAASSDATERHRTH